MGVVGVFGNAELGAQLRYARIFDLDRGLLLAVGRRVFERRSVGDLDHRSVALAAQFGEFCLQLLVELLRRIVAVERRRGVFGGGYGRQPLVWIGRVLGGGAVSSNLGPLPAPALPPPG